MAKHQVVVPDTGGAEGAGFPDGAPIEIRKISLGGHLDIVTLPGEPLAGFGSELSAISDRELAVFSLGLVVNYRYRRREGQYICSCCRGTHPRDTSRREP